MNIHKLALALAPALVAAPLAAAEDRGHACLIEPWQRIELRSPVEALIEAIHVDRGGHVRRGEVVVSLDSGVELSALKAARYRATTEGPIKAAEAKVANTREKFERRDDLARQNMMAAQERDDALAEMRVAEANLIEARENRKAAELEASRLAELLRLRTIRSPFTGIVTERLQNPGEMSQTGESARPILKLAQTDRLRVEVVLPSSLHGTLKPGQAADVEVEPPLKGSYRALVQVVDRVVDSASGTFGVRLELQNPKGEIPAGVKCRARFQAAAAAKATP
jgi:RND family efflux transporter MFP subunit